jgi:hypothetical protein
VIASHRQPFGLLVMQMPKALPFDVAVKGWKNKSANKTILLFNLYIQPSNKLFGSKTLLNRYLSF